MLPSFKQDFWALARAMGHGCRQRIGCCDDPEPPELVHMLFSEGLYIHPVLDMDYLYHTLNYVLQVVM
jgi:hypothetical protein